MIFNLNPGNIELVDTNFDLILVIPIYNEEKNIESVLKEWTFTLTHLNIKFNFLIINDGSKDSTVNIIRNLNYDNLIIVNKLNSGHGSSCRYGYEIVAKLQNKWVLQIDSDGQCRPENFNKFWENRSSFDILIGNRVKRNDGFVRFVNSHICIVICKLFFNLRIYDPNVPYRLIKSNLLLDFVNNITPSINLQNIALSIFLSKNKHLSIKNINIDFPKRVNDNSKTNYFEIFRLGINLLFDFKKL